MVNPGAFRGSRKDFLLSQKTAYAEAVIGGYVADTLADIQRKFFKRYPINLAHDEEPSEEYLAAVDDNAPDPEVSPPDAEKLTGEEYEDAIRSWEERGSLIRFRKAQIKRWMAYQHLKDQDTDASDSKNTTTYAETISHLTGKDLGRPRKRTAVNVWRKSQRHNIEAKVKELAQEQNIPKDRWAALRDKVARQMFNELPAAIQEKWKKEAEEETRLALESYNRSSKADPSTAPEDRQNCIQSLVRVSQPFLDALTKTTGWNFTLMGGGPEPAHAGQLNILSVHSGFTPGDIKMNFGRAERGDYKKYFVPVFGRFLKKCFSPEECRSRALTPADGLAPLREADLETSGANLDLLEGPELRGEQNPSSNTDLHQSTVTCENLAGPSPSSNNSQPTFTPNQVATPSSTTPRQTPNVERSSAAATPPLAADRSPPSQADSCTKSTAAASPSSSIDPSPLSLTSPARSAPGRSVSPPRLVTTSHQELSESTSSAGPADSSTSAAATSEISPEHPSPPSSPGLLESRFGTIPSWSPPRIFEITLSNTGRGSPPLSPAASPPVSPCPSPPMTPRATPRASPRPRPLGFRIIEGPSSPGDPSTCPISSVPERPSSAVEATCPEERPPLENASTRPSSSLPGSQRPQPGDSPTCPTSLMPKSQNPPIESTYCLARRQLPPSSPYPTPPAELLSAITTRSSKKRRLAETPPLESDKPTSKRPRTSRGPCEPSDSDDFSTTTPTRKCPSEMSLSDHDAPLAKRPRSSSMQSSETRHDTPTTTSTTKLVGGPDAPRWFEDALLMLQMQNLGPQWWALLEAWLAFEVAENFKEHGKLPAQYRPSCIGDWIQRKRSTTWRPVVDIKDVEKKFRKWWVSLQPEWRLSEDGKIIRSAVDGDWSCLRKPGLNGLYSVVAALFFWGIDAQKLGSVEEGRWLPAVEDVTRVLNHLLKSKDISAG